MNTNLYLDFIKQTLRSDGIQVADIANKLALKAKQITIEQYSAAARLIADDFLNSID